MCYNITNIEKIDYDENLYDGTKHGSSIDWEKVKETKTYRRSLNRVNFATGLLYNEDYLYISLGVNDVITKIATIRKEKLDKFIK